MSIVLVKPIKNNKAHFVGAKQTVEEIDPVSGVKRELFKQKFEENRFPGTSFTIGVPWDLNKGRFKLTGMSKDELNSYVKDLKFSYEDGPRKGTLIKEADIYDQLDPFFNHRRLKMKSNGGVIALDKEKPLHYLLYKSCLEHPDFWEKSSGAMPGNVKFVITDAEKDTALETEAVVTRLEALAKITQMTHAKKVTVGIALGLPINDKTDPDTVVKLLVNFIENPNRQQNGKFNKDIFLAAANEKAEDVELKALIEKAKKASVIREQKNKGYLYNGNVIAKSQEEMVEFLKNLNNKDVFDRIVEAIEEKK